jgi:hypothetical protein
MIPGGYTTENMASQHRQALLREAEQERMLAQVDGPKHLLQGLAGKLGSCLLLLGTRLQQFERRGAAVLNPSQSR